VISGGLSKSWSFSSQKLIVTLSKSSSGHLKKSANPLNYFALKTQFLALTFIYQKYAAQQSNVNWLFNINLSNISILSKMSKISTKFENVEIFQNFSKFSKILKIYNNSHSHSHSHSHSTVDSPHKWPYYNRPWFSQHKLHLKIFKIFKNIKTVKKCQKNSKMLKFFKIYNNSHSTVDSPHKSLS
jgi:hypothetical protein